MIGWRQAALSGAVLLSACASTPSTDEADAVPAAAAPLVENAEVIGDPFTAAGYELTPVDITTLPHWEEGLQNASLTAFLRSCPQLARIDAHANAGFFGDAESWRRACTVAGFAVVNDDDDARSLFEMLFAAYAVSAPERENGFVTAYFEPELAVSRTRSEAYPEPILAAPESALRDRSRAEIYAALDDYSVLAWGGVADVTYLQIQGSGRLRFDDGTIARAGFAAHNDRSYRSILAILHDAGELAPLAREDVTNDHVRAWLDAAALQDARAMLNQNPRYIFFSERPVTDSASGPVGAAGLALTPEASIAVDPVFAPYGSLHWIAPVGEGAPAARLGVAQDTGAAIRGALRADLFFGAGDEAGARADEVEHAARWYVLIPRGVFNEGAS